jgi:hypothetical protein
MKNLRKRLKKKAKRLALKAAVAGVQMGGKALGNATGGSVSKALTKAAVKQLAKGAGAYGRGDYGLEPGELMVPQSVMGVNSLFKEYPHRRHRTSHYGDETGRVRVSRREYVMKIVSPTTPSVFTNTKFAINPGLSGVFAWLSQVAANYDEYDIEHLVFHYKPVVSKASQSGSMGSILMASNANAGAAKFETFREMAEYDSTKETRICDEALFGVEMDKTKAALNDMHYVRVGAVPYGEDVKTYDSGSFQVATSDINASDFPAGTLLGHLYVEYEVTLGRPKLFAALGKAILADLFRSEHVTDKEDPFGVTTGGYIAHPGNTLGATLVGGGWFGLPDEFYGTLLINYHVAGTGITWDDPQFGPDANIVYAGNMGRSGIDDYEPVNNGNTTASIGFMLIVGPPYAPGGNLIHIRIAAATTIKGFAMDITQTNPLINTAWS